MTTDSAAIWLGDDGKLSATRVPASYTPAGFESLVQVKFSGVNPADQRHFLPGLHSFIAGYEFSSNVIAVGPLSPYESGDVIFGMNRAQHQRPAALGAHQDFAIAESRCFFKLPTGMKLEVAAATTLVAQTALDGLFNCLNFGFPAAGLDGEDRTGVPILIWGGASGVGTAAIQLAKSAGFSPIVTTASFRNHGALFELGATHTFDYRSARVVDDIRSVIARGGKELLTVFDAVVGGADPLVAPDQRTPFSESTPALARSCCSDSSSGELKLVAVLNVEDPTFKHAVCWGPLGELDFFGKPQNPELPLRVRRGMEWIVENQHTSWRHIYVLFSPSGCYIPLAFFWLVDQRLLIRSFAMAPRCRGTASPIQHWRLSIRLAEYRLGNKWKRWENGGHKQRQLGQRSSQKSSKSCSSSFT